MVEYLPQNSQSKSRMCFQNWTQFGLTFVQKTAREKSDIQQPWISLTTVVKLPTTDCFAFEFLMTHQNGATQPFPQSTDYIWAKETTQNDAENTSRGFQSSNPSLLCCGNRKLGQEPGTRLDIFWPEVLFPRRCHRHLNLFWEIFLVFIENFKAKFDYRRSICCQHLFAVFQTDCHREKFWLVACRGVVWGVLQTGQRDTLSFKALRFFLSRSRLILTHAHVIFLGFLVSKETHFPGDNPPVFCDIQLHLTESLARDTPAWCILTLGQCKTRLSLSFLSVCLSLQGTGSDCPFWKLRTERRFCSPGAHTQLQDGAQF